MGEIAGGKGGTRWRGAKGENWDNCNSIINKIYYKRFSVEEQEHEREGN